MATRAKPWTYRGWVVTPAKNWFMGQHWRIEIDRSVEKFPRTCSAMEIPVNSYRERARAREAIDRDHGQAVENARKRKGSRT